MGLSEPGGQLQAGKGPWPVWLGHPVSRRAPAEVPPSPAPQRLGHRDLSLGWLEPTGQAPCEGRRSPRAGASSTSNRASVSRSPRAKVEDRAQELPGVWWSRALVMVSERTGPRVPVGSCALAGPCASAARLLPSAA